LLSQAVAMVSGREIAKAEPISWLIFKQMIELRTAVEE
jgi:hypothetical protein